MSDTNSSEREAETQGVRTCGQCCKFLLLTRHFGKAGDFKNCPEPMAIVESATDAMRCEFFNRVSLSSVTDGIRPLNYDPTEPARMLSDMQTWLIGAVGRHAGVEFDFVANRFRATLTEPSGERSWREGASPLTAMHAVLRQAKENER